MKNYVTKWINFLIKRIYLNDLLKPSDNLQKEIEKIIKQFEETTKNFYSINFGKRRIKYY